LEEEVKERSRGWGYRDREKERQSWRDIVREAGVVDLEGNGK
jgi:hypothetical protein